MKGAFLLSFDDAIIAKVRRDLSRTGAEGWHGCTVLYEGPDAVQVQETGTDHLFSLDQYDDRPDFAWAYRDPPHFPAPGVTMPDLSQVLAYGIDCRWEDLFARLVGVVAEISADAAWVLDDEAVVWDARAVDPARVRL